MKKLIAFTALILIIGFGVSYLADEQDAMTDGADEAMVEFETSATDAMDAAGDPENSVGAVVGEAASNAAETGNEAAEAVEDAGSGAEEVHDEMVDVSQDAASSDAGEMDKEMSEAEEAAESASLN